MARTPSVKKMAVVVAPSALCPRCGYLGHLMTDHDEDKARGCQKCACIAQDVS